MVKQSQSLSLSHCTFFVSFSQTETIPDYSTDVLYLTFISTYRESLRCTHATDKLFFLCIVCCIMSSEFNVLLKYLVHSMTGLVWLWLVCL